MTWLRVDDGFTETAKALVLSDAALAMWLRVACWAQRDPNRHLRGFIPSKVLPGIAKVSPKRAQALAAELVAATGGKDFGIWEKREDGWQIHDWDKYQPPAPKMTTSEAASLAGKASAESRKLKTGSSQPKRPERQSNVRETFETTLGEHVRDSRSTNEPPNLRTPGPGPGPGPLEEEETSAPRTRVQTGGDVPCPPDLRLTAAEASGLIMGLGMTQEVIDRWTPVLLAKFASAESRTLERWRRSLVTALTQDWQRRRDEMLDRRTKPRTHKGKPVQPNHGQLDTSDFLAKHGHGKAQGE